ncbi:hypothetical protein LCL99_00395 [Halomonas denitrificans]|uniref:hypothetical protein n=1 Tax=Halomonas TaxID=2745 RepID=UPI001A8BF75F|nr:MULTISPECIES: hypothetical protein [Halomonas]MED5293936.1 hypothetical protein [Pseudomonadota bacterium]MBN8414160.1 hypothetical protein [Halomonas litopenaei]MBY5930857.1 hypothetical protein [Halomonas sp. DP8Y7-3]MBY5970399.1 hypothetical protein [Halomonas denitrificans]MBY6027804.1 hypothetical protein [Halomonas sp. DP8Y7-1]
MTSLLIWVLAFAVLLAVMIKSWEKGLGCVLDGLLPSVLRSDDDRWIWCPALAVLGATFIVFPIDMLMTLLVIGVIALVACKLGCWVMGKVH